MTLQRPRCRGHCCRSFTIPPGPELLARMGEAMAEFRAAAPGEERMAVYERWKEELVPMSRDADIVAAMVIYLGEHESNPVFGGAAGAPGERAHYYTCRHLQPTGDCGNYDGRPSLCRSYGTAPEEPCQYAMCACKPLLTG